MIHKPMKDSISHAQKKERLIRQIAEERVVIAEEMRAMLPSQKTLRATQWTFDSAKSIAYIALPIVALLVFKARPSLRSIIKVWGLWRLFKNIRHGIGIGVALRESLAKMKASTHPRAEQPAQHPQQF